MRRVWVVYVVVFAGFVGYSLMIAVFTPLLLHDRGHLLAPDASHATRTTVLGVLLSLYPLGQFLGAPVLGALADRWGRQPVLLGSLTLGVTGYALITLTVAVGNLPALMVVCFLAGLGEANITIAQSSIADIAHGARRATLFGYVYLASSLAYVVGPLVGGPLADRKLVHWARDWAPFALVTGLLVVTLMAVATLLPETRVVQAIQRPTASRRTWIANVTGLVDVVRDARLRWFYLINALFYLAAFGFLRMYPLYLVDHFGLSVGAESVFVAWVAVPIMAANLWLVGVLFRRSSPPRVLFGAGLLTGLSSFLVPLPGVLGLLWLTLAMTALGVALLLAFCSAQLSSAASDAEQGRVMGANQSVQVGAEVISGFVGGVLAAAASGLPLEVFGVFAVIAALLTLARSGPRHRSARPVG